jgi:2-C-methyl-D-erythritol 4-phosphate cytidylyltransferase
VVSVSAILLAAGRGERLDLPVPKAFVELAGRPLFAFSLEAIAASSVIDEVLLVVPGTDLELARGLVAALPQRACVRAIVPGGVSRQDSVALGLAALGGGADVAVCHDAARPFATPELFARVLGPLGRGAEGDAKGAVPILQTPDTVKRVRGGQIVDTLPRDEIGLAQTPQAFQAEALREAHRRADREGRQATDDAMLLEAAGYRVAAVEGEATNFKITSAEDLLRAERVLAGG